MPLFGGVHYIELGKIRLLQVARHRWHDLMSAGLVNPVHNVNCATQRQAAGKLGSRLLWHGSQLIGGRCIDVEILRQAGRPVEEDRIPIVSTDGYDSAKLLEKSTEAQTDRRHSVSIYSLLLGSKWGPQRTLATHSGRGRTSGTSNLWSPGPEDKTGQAGLG